MYLFQFNARPIYLSDLFKQKTMVKLIVCMAVCLFLSTVSSAQTRYYVNQAVASSGDGKSWGAAFKNLSEAIKVASSTVADEIWVAKGTYYPNTNHFGTRYDPPSFSYSMTYLVKKPMKIYGGFAGTETALTQRNWETNETILSGNIKDLADSTDNIYHVVLIVGTETSPLKNVTVDGFTISDGYANVITTITVDGNVINAYNGGGIYNVYASPELKNLKIIRNVGFVGGGIHNKNSSPMIDNCQILQNYSGSSGGGIYNLRGSPVIRNTLIANNYVNNIGGGGIDNLSSDVRVQNSTIKNNRASKGGGIYSDGGNVTLENVIVENNKATTDGGGVYNFSKTNLTMKHVSITDNKAQFGGGMRTFRAHLQIDSSQIANNTADYYGGGIYADGDSLRIQYSNIDSNKATTYQGGGFFVENAFVAIKGGTIKGNSAKTDAGGILFRYSTHGTVENVEISKNISNRYGGGIYLSGNSDPAKQFKFTKVVFSENEGFSGGGMHLNSTSPVLDDVTFAGNTTKDAGAGLMVSAGAYPNLSNSLFKKNKAASGGGMFSQNGAGATLNNVSFLENEAANYGGGIYCGGTGDFNKLNLKGNKAKNGGGIYLAGTANLTNALITGNYVSEKGGGIYIDRSAPVLTNITLAGNNALQEGGGIYALSSSNSKIRNTVIYGNSTGLVGSVKLSYSLVEGKNDAANGNISGAINPEFVGPQPYANAPFITGNYLLKAASPVIDKGDNTVFQPGITPDLSGITTDLLGNTRFYKAIADMGAFEYQPGIALPVELVSFDAVLNKNIVEVSWEIMDEVNVYDFEIERSENGVSFGKIGVQQANGSKIYDFNDTKPPQGNIYYRLKIIYKDKNSAYSIVKTVFAPVTGISEMKSDSRIIVYPVPTNGSIHIADKNKTLITGLFRVFTATGKMVIQTDSNPVDIHSLVPGMYFIHVSDTRGKFIDKQMIIKY